MEMGLPGALQVEGMGRGLHTPAIGGGMYSIPGSLLGKTPYTYSVLRTEPKTQAPSFSRLMSGHGRRDEVLSSFLHSYGQHLHWASSIAVAPVPRVWVLFFAANQ